jgi:serine/threonine-protein kinase
MRWLTDRYRLDDQVGRGGMAVVWRGYDRVLRRVVAIKMLPDRGVDSRSRKRLRDEAHAAARLSHPAIASVYDYGEAAVGFRRRAPFLVMEYVDGPTLAARLSAGALPRAEAMRTCTEVAAALAFAHANKLVHRDVKPANVMLSPFGVKVVDFGIASASGQHQVDGDGRVFGTRAYMAPEQMSDAPVAAASDVYALGLLLHQCLTGARPHAAGDSDPTVPGGLGGPRALPLLAGVPALVSDLVTACLATDPARRPTSAEVAETLHRATADAVAPLPGIRAGVPRADTPTVAQGTPTGCHVPWHRSLILRARTGRAERRRGVALTQAALAVAAAAILTIALAVQLPGAASSDAMPSVVPPPDGPDQRPATDCTTRFSAKYRADGTFTAVLDVTYTGVASLSAWSVRFAMPAGQHVAGADLGRWMQDEGIVTISTDQPLLPGQTVTVALHGTASSHGDPPRGFTLDGHACSRSATDLEATRSVTVPGPTRTVREPRRQPDVTGPPQPTPRQPEPSEPHPSEPSAGEPHPSEPAPTEPQPSEPSASEPQPSEPTIDPGDPSPINSTPAGPTASVPTTLQADSSPTGHAQPSSS